MTDEALQLVSRVPPFDGLSSEKRAGLAASVHEVRAVPGQVVVREGERGDRMYLIASGSVQVVGRAFDGSEIVLARLEAGEYFGEQALLSSATVTRNATVRALTNCRLLVLTREALLDALESDGEFARRLREAGERQQELKKSRLREDVLRHLGGAERYRIERYEPGTFVFHEGDRADRVYLVLSGSARVTRVENGQETHLAELLPGQHFGELAILHDQPRTASVCAGTSLEVASLDARWFRATLAELPQLRSIMTSLESMYMLPRRGLITRQSGMLASHPTVTTIHDLPDGRRVISTRLVGVSAFTSRVLGAPEADRSARYVDPDGDAVREIHVAEGRVVEIESSGEWSDLGEVLSMLLDGTALDESQLRGFESHGTFDVADRPRARRGGPVCACAGVFAEAIWAAIETGCDTVDQVAARTNATLVCGGCLPTVKEILGQTSWTLARCETVVPLSEDVRSFRIKPVDHRCQPYLAGQHLVIQARIDDVWIQRPYTISSAPGRDTYEITVKREPEGVFSRWLFDRMPCGALLRISPPAGSFCLPTDGGADVVCLVAGIGVTPALAMARTQASSPRVGRLYIDYSISEESQAICREELERIAQGHANIDVHVRVTRREGRLGADDTERLAREFPEATFYLCGSDGYMDAVSGYLAAAGVPPAKTRREKFTVAGERPTTVESS